MKYMLKIESHRKIRYNIGIYYIWNINALNINFKGWDAEILGVSIKYLKN